MPWLRERRARQLHVCGHYALLQCCKILADTFYPGFDFFHLEIRSRCTLSAYLLIYKRQLKGWKDKNRDTRRRYVYFSSSHSPSPLFLRTVSLPVSHPLLRLQNSHDGRKFATSWKPSLFEMTVLELEAFPDRLKWSSL